MKNGFYWAQHHKGYDWAIVLVEDNMVTLVEDSMVTNDGPYVDMQSSGFYQIDPTPITREVERKSGLYYVQREEGEKITIGVWDLKREHWSFCGVNHPYELVFKASEERIKMPDEVI